MSDFIDIEQLLSEIPGHVYWLNRDNVYQGYNDSQAKALGLSSSKEIVGKRNIDFPCLTSEIIAIWDKNNIEVMRSGIEKIYEEPTFLKDGKWSVMLSHKKPLFNRDKHVIGLVGTSIDISQKNKIEAELKKELMTLDLAFENIITNLPGHVYWQDRNNVFLGCNEAQAKSAGLKSRHDIVGKTNYDMPWKEQGDSLNQINNQIMLTGKEYSVEEVAVLSNGEKAFFLSKKVPLRDYNGNIVGIMGISFNITDRKNMESELELAKEKAEAANHAKTEFLENMRHDIRTPLSGIVGCSEIIAHTSDLELAKKFSLLLKQSCDELLKFLNEILESINVATGEIPILKKRFNLRETMERLIALHLPKAHEKDLRLELDFDQAVPKALIGDPVRIYRIVLELLVNALKFTQEGYVKIIVSLAKEKEREAVIRVVVEDTGPGISEEKQQELFMRFHRFTPSYKGIYKGSRLGLSIVKQFVDELDGEINVENKANGGSKFTFLVALKLPLIEAL